MDERLAPDALLCWGLAAFHTAVLVLVLVMYLYGSAPLGELLAEIQTSIGLLLYGALWGITWWSNHRWLQETQLLEADAVSDPDTVILAGFKWGGTTGVIFFGVLIVLLILPQIPLGGIPFVVLLALIGAIVAFAIGGLLGGIFAVADIVLFWVADQLVSATDQPSDTP